MTKNKKIVIGVLSLVILLLAGFVYYREIAKKSTLYQEYCKYFSVDGAETQFCCDDFIAKCEKTGGKFIGRKDCAKKVCSNSCPKGAICGDAISYCLDLDNICKCPFLKVWSSEKGCTYL